MGVVRQRWRKMRKGRERARKGEEMAGWDEDELVGSLRSEDDKRPREPITTTSLGSLDRDLAIET